MRRSAPLPAEPPGANRVTEPDNPYRVPQAPLLAETPLADEALAAFLKPNAHYYLRKWRALREGHSRLAGFNWAAAFFPVYWLLYRRFFLIGVVWAGLSVVIGIAAGGTAASLDLSLPLLVALVRLPEFLLAGLLANLLLYRKAERIARSTPLSELKDRRATSELAVWLAIALYVGLPFLMMFLSVVGSVAAPGR